MEERLILVDELDHPVGTMEKMEVHRAGVLHRAFSIFIFDGEGNVLLQQRARSKYHSGGLWSNTCCSHPREGEDLEAALHRALEHEMGFDCALKKVMDFVYRAEVGGGLVEHEFDHVFAGVFTGIARLNPDEADDIRWVTPEALYEDVETNPQCYTPWFRIILQQISPADLRLFTAERNCSHCTL